MAYLQVQRLAIEGVLFGQPHVNVLHCASESVPGTTYPTDWQALANAFIDAIKTPLCNQISWGTLKVTDLALPPRTWEYALSKVGASASADGLPANAPIVLSWKTGYAGRSYRGRQFVSGLAEAGHLGGIMDSTYLSNLQSAINTFLGNWGDGGTLATNIVFGVWSEKLGTTKNVAGEILSYNYDLGFHPIETGVVRSAIANMRGRRYGT